MAYPITVSDPELPLQCLFHWARTRPDAVYLTQPLGHGTIERITWAQAADQVRRAAAWLQSHGWPAGSRIAIIGKNSAHWLLSDLAIFMAGYVSVPIYPTFNAKSVAYILEHSEARALFVGKLDDASSIEAGVPEDTLIVTLPLAPALPGKRWESVLANTPPLTAEPTSTADALATIIYTSGTTGMPKGVMHTFGSLAWNVSSTLRRIPMQQQDRLLSYLPLAHVAERILVEQALLRFGGQVFFAESLQTFIQDIQRARPTVFFSVPRLWVKFQQGVQSKLPQGRLDKLLAIPLVAGLVRRKILRGLGLDQCRIAAGGAAPMPAQVLQWYRRLGLDLIEVYGMTELGGASHSTLPGGTETGSVGQPLDGIACRIDPANGEVQVQAPCTMQGYYREPAQTAAALTPDGWMRTGDQGSLDHQGNLRITGRVKDIFKTSKGKYVAPAPIEDLLVMHPDVEACAVTGAQFAQPFAIVMLSADAAQGSTTGVRKQLLEQSLAEHLARVNTQLAAHEKLDFLAVVTTAWTPENGLVTPTLKVRRTRVEETYAGHYDTWAAQKARVVWAQN